jgi:hypothetical protein
MASFIKNMTQVGGGSRQIARLLQAKAPPNHILAYITPEEADLLEARGGSGKEDPNTGIPTFEVEPDPLGELPPEYVDQFGSAQTFPVGDTAPMEFDFAPPPPAPVEVANVPPITPQAMDLFSGADIQSRGLVEAQARQPAALAAPAAGGDDFLKRLALAGVTGLFGARQARAAQRAAGVAAEEQRALGRPYQEQGRQLQAAAQRGELSPVAQQSMQALRARLAQGAQARGGVGAAQAMQQAENFRQQLLQQQFDFGLKLAQIGDQYAAGAIKTGLQADQYVNSLTNSFFSNIARTLFSQPAQQPQPPGGR